MLLCSASSEASAKIGREDAAERAALVLGVQVMRQMLGQSALADAEPRTLVHLLAPLFEQLLGKPREQAKA